PSGAVLVDCDCSQRSAGARRTTLWAVNTPAPSLPRGTRDQRAPVGDGRYFPHAPLRLACSVGHRPGVYRAQLSHGARAAPRRRQDGGSVPIMQRLRSTWMALMAGALLITLSVSAAFGADPVAEKANRGQ